MKKLTMFTTASLCLAMLTACSTNGVTTVSSVSSEAPASSEDTTEAVVLDDNNTAPSSEDIQKFNAKDYEAQLDLIASNYDSLNEKYPYNEYEEPVYFAVTDFNHNGRLEFILTTCQGSGAFSYTQFFEVSEDLSKLVKVENDAFSSEMQDATSDFTMNATNSGHSVVYDCFKKDGEYYYMLQDYTASGWKEKSLWFSSYCFRDKIKCDTIGGSSISADMDAKKVSVWLKDASGNLFTDGEQYAKALNAYWDGYERQKCCEVRWVPYGEKSLFADALKESLNGFDPDSDKKSEIYLDYKDFYSKYYEKDYEFVIQDQKEPAYG